MYREIKDEEGFDFHYDRKGLFMLCQTDTMLEKEAKVVDMAKSMDLEARMLSLEEVRRMEPDVEIDALGAAYFECDHHTTPHEFMTELRSWLEKKGVSIVSGTEVVGFDIAGGAIKVARSVESVFEGDEFIMAAGSWSPQLAKQLGLKLLMQAGKGYRIDSYRETGITIPAILAESKAAVTPMNGFTRYAGTMEIAGINARINPIRVNAIANAIQRYYPGIEVSEAEKQKAACGLRPVSPDGLPYIGKSRHCPNLTVAAGHAMMGWSMGSGTGKLVAEIIAQESPTLDLDPFHPDRRF